MQYYYLIAGLTEYPFDIEHAAAEGGGSSGSRVDVPQIKEQIMSELTAGDRRAVELLYTYYDIENIMGYVRGTKLPFNALGNLSRDGVALLADGKIEEGGSETLLPEELAERLERLAVPGTVRLALDRFAGRVEQTGEDEEGRRPLSADDLERELLESFYRICEAEGVCVCGGGRVPEYLRRWAGYDRTMRNIVAAYKARQLGWPEELKEGMIVESDGEVKEALLNGQAADFGMKDRFPYMDELLQVLETADFVERERKMDVLRVRVADDLAEHDYFGIGRILNYLIRLNILYRWAALDKERGREDFRELVSALTDLDKGAE